MTALVIWLLVTVSHPTGFNARFVTMPPSMSWEMLDRARKASARPSFCQWNYPGTACRVS
jgi:hypothetical protein